ncbi:transposase [Caldanaerobacter subterraneus]|uniref:transposase n=1 Tax=Caldanaerobacter subterraneus TaxID=911092 RepID=UPI00126960C2|nr:transposase [Caldanaerobacter subterraneus]
MLTQILVTQASEQIKAESYKRTEKQQVYRNSYHSRNLVTRVAILPLKSFKTLQW